MKNLGLFICLIAIIICGGCTFSSPNPSKSPTKTVYKVTDIRNKELLFESKPQKIVCTHVFASEILLDLVDHKRIVGLTKWIHDPDLSSASQKAQDIKGIAEVNSESIIKLQPDLVLLSANTQLELINSLEDAGLKVYVFPEISRQAEISPLITTLGLVVSEPEKAQFLIQTMQVKLEKLARKVAALPAEKKQAVLLFLRFGAIGGKETIFGDSLKAAGLYDVYDDIRHKKEQGARMVLSKEEVLRSKPQLILLSSWSQGGSYASSQAQLEELYSDPAYQNLPAIKTRNALVIPQTYVNCLSHNFATAVESLYQKVYEANL